MTSATKQALSGGQAAVEALRNEKTQHVFGLIGSATMEMFDALYDADDIKFIGIHDERTGTHMADGYARASGKALPLARAYPSAICVPVRSSWMPINLISSASYNASNISIVAEPIKPNTC